VFYFSLVCIVAYAILLSMMTGSKVRISWKIYWRHTVQRLPWVEVSHCMHVWTPGETGTSWQFRLEACLCRLRERRSSRWRRSMGV